MSSTRPWPSASSAMCLVARPASLRPRAVQGHALRGADPGTAGCGSTRMPPRRSRPSTPPSSSPISPSWRSTTSLRLPPVVDQAIEYARRAGDQAASQLAYEEAVRLYKMALDAGRRGPSPLRVAARPGGCSSEGGYTATLEASFREAADLAEAARADRAPGESRARVRRQVRLGVPEGDVDHVPLLERALAALGEEDSKLRVRLLARFAAVRCAISASRSRERALSEQALVDGPPHR